MVLARVHTHLELKSARDRLRRDNAALEDEIARRLHENQVVQEVTIRALARLAETRDNETGNHILRTQAYVETLAWRAGQHARFAAALDEHAIALIAKSGAAARHRQGASLTRCCLPGKLTPEEWEVMKTRGLMPTRSRAPSRTPTSRSSFSPTRTRSRCTTTSAGMAAATPDGLAGEAIPLAARLMALADVFDALISRRVYKGRHGARARAIMAEQRGAHFDPDLLDVFLAGFRRLLRHRAALSGRRGMSGGAAGQTRRAALRIALLYGLLAGLWILGSDCAGALRARPRPAAAGAGARGWAFVAVTALLLYALLRRLRLAPALPDAGRGTGAARLAVGGQRAIVGWQRRVALGRARRFRRA